MISNPRPVSHPLGGLRGWSQKVKVQFPPPQPPDTPTSDPGDGVKFDQNSTISEHGHVAYQIKENHDCSNMVPNI